MSKVSDIGAPWVHWSCRSATTHLEQSMCVPRDQAPRLDISRRLSDGGGRPKLASVVRFRVEVMLGLLGSGLAERTLSLLTSRRD
ncbi:hypothetical protein Van01_54720 [Micromonospora andamanensis]|uniref:Uncharacterized protein n=1 Tax=Micromonospora andamanensis TaxID=1287068 RepID=A0ABQ4I2Z9_9ACTN|nr:hypothetical protein Van01_54720 [Micromonospora andamanensis]